MPTTNTRQALELKMRRSICYTEPHIIAAGETSTWKFIYTPSTPLPKGTKLKFDMLSSGRDFDWQIPQTTSKEKKNMIWAEMPDGKLISAKEIPIPQKTTPAFEFTLPAEVKASEAFTIFLGTQDASKEDKAKKGNRAQTVTQRRKPFHLYIDIKGKGDYKEPEVFNIDIRGNILTYIRVIAPSIVAKNKRFDVMLRFEDSHGNLTHNAPEGTLIELSYEHLRENLSWKLFVPETGFLNLPNLYFNESGIYKIQLLNLKTKEKYFSDPIKCFAEFDKSLYWGLLHGESERIDSAENIENCLRLMRDEKSLNFFASSCFESAEETSNDTWKVISSQITEFNEEGRFTTFLGFQWFSEEPTEGLRQCIYLKDGKALGRKKDSKTSSLKKIYKTVPPKEILSIPSFTMAKGFQTTFEDFSDDVERVVEIYNAWGSSECTEAQGNTRPIKPLDKKGICETEKGSIRKALNNNRRFGFVAGGLDDRGIFKDLYQQNQAQYTPGLTAIFAIEQTREALFLALYNRQCYATTGAKIVLGFSIAGASMGSELNTKAKPGLIYNRHISGYVAGTHNVKTVTIIRNGNELHAFKPKDFHEEFTYDDSDHIAKICLAAEDDKSPFVYYYLRVEQEDGHMAWSSPIWIDHNDTVTSSPQVQSKKAKKASK